MANPLIRMARSVAERLARGRQVRRRIHVGGRSVPLFVSPDAQLKYLKPGANAFDADLIGLAERFLESSSVAWDVGANVGVFTFAASAIATEGTVLCIEADIWLAEMLRRSTRLPENQGRDIRVVPVAVAEDAGVESFQVAARGRASNALSSAGGRDQMGGVRETQFVPTTSMDRLLDVFPAPEFVKIDVEGAELMVLRGAVRLLREARPILYVEVGKEVADEVSSLMTAGGYQAYNGRSFEAIDGCSRNTFFVPDEKKAWFEARRP